MKRVIIAAAMVLLLIILASASNLIINKNMKALHNETKSFNENYEKLTDEEAKSKSISIINKWNHTEKLLQIFDSHDKYEEICKHFGQLELHNQKGDIKEVANLMKELQNLIDRYVESRKINLHNILVITNPLQ